MTLVTPVDIPSVDWKIALDDRILLLGSCFSDRMADKMRESYLRVTANPTGTLYNPVSIAHHIDDYAPQADVIIITFGTAWVYLDKTLSANAVSGLTGTAVLTAEGGLTGVADLSTVVDNCHKRPATDFERRRLTVDQIVTLWQPIVERYKDKRFIFTVSPIRHKKDGLHENQLSKGILLQAIEELNVPYYPSYEILLDELRDYRFYAADMVHPSDVAVDILWERFCATYFSADTLKQLEPLHQLWLDEHHRFLHPDSPEAASFAEHLIHERTRLHSLYPNNV